MRGGSGGRGVAITCRGEGGTTAVGRGKLNLTPSDSTSLRVKKTHRDFQREFLKTNIKQNLYNFRGVFQWSH